MARSRMSFAQILSYVVLVGGGVIMLMPFYWLVSTSLKTLQNVYVFPIQWWPDPIRWQNYTELFKFAPVPRYFKNTLILVFFNTIGMVLSSAISAYSFARLRFRGRDLLFAANLAMIMLPFAVVMVPTYVLFTKLGWVGTFLPLIVPQWFGGPITIFLLRQFFRTIPRELEDAALIDGASRPRIFFQIILPLSRPALVVVTIMAVLFNWNNFLQPLIYLTDRSLYTLALAVNSLGMYMPGVPDTVHYQMALSTLMVVPPVILYFLAQRAFIQGIVLTGIKG